jgi:O-antigen/teichoic acid export membrane protein
MAEHLSKLLRSTLLYLPAQFTPPFVQFVTTVVWTYLLDPATFGFVTFIIAVQEIMACAGLTGWTLFVLRYRERFRGHDQPRFLAMDKRFALLASAVQLVLTPPLLYVLALPCDAATMIATSAYLITRMLFAHYADWARADQAIGAYTTGQFMASVVGSGLSVVAILLFGPSCAVVLGAVAVGQALALAVLMVQTKVRFGLGAFDKALFQEVKRYAKLAIVGGMVGWAAGNVIRVLVQYIDGPVALGLISVGWSLGQRIAGVLAMLLTAAAYPLAVKHLESGDRKGALAQVSFNGLLLLGVLLPAAVGTLTLAKPVVTLLIAEQFRDTTIIILPIALCAAGLRYLRIHTCEQTMLLLERPELSMVVVLIEAALNITLCAGGLYVGGFYGAALGMLVGSALTCVGTFGYCFGKLGLPAPALSTVLRIIVACCAMSLVVRALPVAASAPSLTLAIGLGATIYAVAITLLFPEVRALLVRRVRHLSGAPTL